MKLKISIRIFWCMMLFLIIFQGFSQNRELHLGDTMPDFEIKKIINYKTSSTRISQFKSQLLILDFWATWCAPCIGSFPKLDSLQKKFSNKIQILPVTYEDSILVTKFLNRMVKSIGILPATVTNDYILSKVFKHSSLPHYVWLDSNRKIVAISDGDAVTSNNISAFLNHDIVNVKMKVDEELNLVNVPALTPTIQVLNGKDTSLRKLNDSALLVHTILTNYISGFISGGSFKDSTYFSIRNSSIATLYKIALFGNSLSVLNTSTVQ
jgi:thiol-disulfide isomerase/thioredoxin